MGMEVNGNWLHGNRREWECKKPLRVISTLHHNVSFLDFMTFFFFLRQKLPWSQCAGLILHCFAEYFFGEQPTTTNQIRKN